MAERILIVDDDPGVRAALNRALTGAGYATDVASDGAQALELLRKNGADLVILDLVMDKMNGAEFLETKATEPSIAGVPVIAVSGHFATPDIPHVAWVLAKPFELDDLLMHVRAAIRRMR